MGGVFFDTYNNDLMKRVYSADSLAKIVKDSVDYYEQEAKASREKASRTREEVKSEILNEYEEENRVLKKKLERAVAILYSDKELKSFMEFRKEHEKCRVGSRADSGRMPYVIQVGTGIGVATTVVCPVCGERKDITDFAGW